MALPVVSKVKLFCNLNKIGRRFLSTSNALRLKEIVHTEQENMTVIEAVKVKSPREGKVLKAMTDSKACPLCKLGLKNIKHTDVLILSQFIASDGSVLPSKVTGLCGRQHRKICILVNQAQKAGLMPTPVVESKEPWELNNTYFKTAL
ncbi:large ribosomal subunit protein mL66-like [Centruroides vittatus]|uniref:large ribosomal subunit protein mL66-like n=1 Tax=Centruroides vittatus TaxID=120091 RepID=UPI00350FF225